MAVERAASRAAGSATVRATRSGPRRRRVSAFWVSVPVLLVLWQLLVVALEVPPFLLPTPLAIANSLWYGLIADPFSKVSLIFQMATTLQGALLGYLIGSAAGIGLGILISESRALNDVLLPYAVGLQSLPKVAIAPLILIWFGYGLPSAIVMAALLTFFPLLINTYTGLTLVERDFLVLMRGMRSSRLQILAMVKLPSALPVIFAGLDVAIVYSLLGALVAEFVAGNAGIGVAILQAQFISNTAGVFAALTVLAVTANTLHNLVRLVERKLVFWRKHDELQALTPND
jgi:NitT/TauT family transport system permease protein